MRGLFAGVLAAILLALPAQLPAQAPPRRAADKSDAFFDKGEIPKLRIEIAPAELEKLNAENRTYVRCTIRENDKVTYKQAMFLPHGMDQMFGDPGASLLDHPAPLLSSAVMQHDAWRLKYRERIRQLLPSFSPPDKLLRRVDEVHGRLRPVLAEMNPDLPGEHANRVKELKERIIARAASLKEQSNEPDRQPLDFGDKGEVVIADWYPASEAEDAVLKEIEKTPGGRKVYAIACGPSGQGIASWRRRVLLSAGTYTLHAEAKTTGVVPLDDEKGSAAGLRISGLPRTNKLQGTSAWVKQQFEFTVAEDRREVELVAELRAKKGEVWFDAASLKLTRKPR